MRAPSVGSLGRTTRLLTRENVMQRITLKNLEALAATINRETGSPATYCNNDGGKFKANVGHYHMDGAYGGYKLVRVVNEGGGIICITSGYLPKREVYDLMHAFLAGIRAQQ